MKVKLSIANRLSLLGLLPEQGDITTIKIIRELREELSFTAEEHELIKFKPTGGNKVLWDDAAIPDKEVIFTGIREVIIEGVKTALRKEEETGKLLLDHLSLYEVLIEGKGQLELVDKEKKKEIGSEK